MGKKKLARVVINENIKAFVIHLASLSTIHLVKKAQIFSLFSKEVKIPNKYLDYADIFLEKKAAVLPEITNLNQRVIKLQDSQQPSCSSIYNLEPV